MGTGQISSRYCLSELGFLDPDSMKIRYLTCPQKKRAPAAEEVSRDALPTVGKPSRLAPEKPQQTLSGLFVGEVRV
jgi:hypothetical protein